MSYLDDIRSLIGGIPGAGDYQALFNGDRSAAPNLNAPRVLARLNVPGASPQGQFSPTISPAAGDGGFGTDLAAGLKAGGISKGGSFLAGLAGSMKSVDDRQAAADKSAIDTRKANVDLLKSMFDMSSKVQQADRQAAQDDITNQRNAASDAETKRWHDIMAPSYQDKGSKNGNTLNPKDAALTAMRMSGYNPASAGWELVDKDTKAQRQRAFQNLFSRFTGKPYPLDKDGNLMPLPSDDGDTGGGPPAGGFGAPSDADYDPNGGLDDGGYGPEGVPAAAPSGAPPVMPSRPAAAPPSPLAIGGASMPGGAPPPAGGPSPLAIGGAPPLTPPGGGTSPTSAPQPTVDQPIPPKPAASPAWQVVRKKSTGETFLRNPATGELQPMDSGLPAFGG